MQIELIIFDFDGTLFDTKKDIAMALNHALKKSGLQVLDENSIWKMTGNGTPALVKRALGDMSDKTFEKILNETINYYQKHSADFAKPVDNVEIFLKETDRIPKAIISNKYRYFIEQILEKFSFSHYFKEIYGREDFETNKPEPEPLLYVLDKFRANRDRTVYIGDTVVDVIFSKNAGVRSCIIPSGASSLEEIIIEDPDIIFYDYRGLFEKIQLL